MPDSPRSPYRAARSPGERTRPHIPMREETKGSAVGTPYPLSGKRDALWSASHRHANAAYARGDYRACIDHLLSALGAASCFDLFDPRRATTLNDLGELSRLLARYDDADIYFQRAHTLRHDLLGPTHPHTLLTRFNQAALLYDLGRQSEAECELHRLLEYHERHHGVNHPIVALTLYLSALLSHAQLNDDAAETLLKRARDILQSLGDRCLAETVRCDGLHAELLLERGSPAAALRIIQRKLDRLSMQLGPDHPCLIEPLLIQAACALAENRLPQAEEHLNATQRLLALRLPDHHPLMLRFLHLQARLHAAQQRYDEADLLLNQAMALGQTLWPSRHPEMATLMIARAQLARSRNAPTEAEQWLLQAIKWRGEILGEAHALLGTAYRSLGRCLLLTNRMGEAENAYRRALAILRTALGEKHMQTASTWTHLATWHRHNHDVANADTCYARATAIYRAKLGLEHPHTLSVLHAWGWMLAESGEHERARQSLETVFKHAPAAWAPDHPMHATLNRSQSAWRHRDGLPVSAISPSS